MSDQVPTGWQPEHIWASAPSGPPPVAPWQPVPGGGRRKRFGFLALFLAFGAGAAVVVVAMVALVALAESDPLGSGDAITTTFGPLGAGSELPVVGDCLRGAIDAPGLISADEVVPCHRDHSSEVSAVVTVPGGPRRPAGDDLDLFADDACFLAFEAYVGTSYDNSDLDYAAAAPNAAAWKAGDRRIWCLVDTSSQAPGSGSVRGTGR